MEADIGKNLSGKVLLKYQSGWLKAMPGIGLSVDGEEKNAPLLVKPCMDIELSGLPVSASLLVREVKRVDEMVRPISEEAFSVGRASANNITIRDAVVSACHGRFYKDGDDHLVYVDLGRNGTYLNGELMGNEGAELQAGDVLFIPPFYTMTVNQDSLVVSVPKA